MIALICSFFVIGRHWLLLGLLEITGSLSLAVGSECLCPDPGKLKHFRSLLTPSVFTAYRSHCQGL
jgi:hypothetical protein